jgi:alpha-glucosidase (family GH31 glycosyl hydrolase)
MIGGNAYGVYPDAQLFIRWAQLTAFLPSMQFSIPPWHYKDSNVTKICQSLVVLHEQVVFPFLKLYAGKSTETGEPIIRPLWWADNSDENTLIIDDQFLIGDYLLVAPVLDMGYIRDIYLPQGNWIYENSSVFSGPVLLKNFNAPIETIPYFFKQN